MTRLIEDVVAEVKPADREIRLNVHPLPAVYADREMMYQVWLNLLSNAIKFSSSKKSPYIEIGCHTENNRITFYIRDNDVGFDMQYADKLFRMFHCLHGAEEFEGTGAGLAIAQRMIQRHGGRIWAEGKLNEGATFYFMFPV